MELVELKLLQLLTNEMLVLKVTREHALCAKGSSRVAHLLMRGGLGGLAAHLHAKASVSTLKVLVVVGSRFRPTSDASKAPPVELASEGRVFAVYLKQKGEL